jgi:hypothetical protein
VLDIVILELNESLVSPTIPFGEKAYTPMIVLGVAKLILYVHRKRVSAWNNSSVLS